MNNECKIVFDETGLPALRLPNNTYLHHFRDVQFMQSDEPMGGNQYFAPCSQLDHITPYSDKYSSSLYDTLILGHLCGATQKNELFELMQTDGGTKLVEDFVKETSKETNLDAPNFSMLSFHKYVLQYDDIELSPDERASNIFMFKNNYVNIIVTRFRVICISKKTDDEDGALTVTTFNLGALTREHGTLCGSMFHHLLAGMELAAFFAGFKITWFEVFRRVPLDYLSVDETKISPMTVYTDIRQFLDTIEKWLNNELNEVRYSYDLNI